MKKTASAHWVGNLKQGKGTISTESGALKDNPYGFNTRFENQPGTNPEELIGAAHAGCFSMAFAMLLGEENFTPDSINTKQQSHWKSKAMVLLLLLYTLRCKRAFQALSLPSLMRLSVKLKSVAQSPNC